jgi:hypothetical protein
VHGTLERLREHYPGNWLLIQLDDSETEEGTVLAAHENPELVDKELERHVSNGLDPDKPLYLTYSIPEGQALPPFVL